MQSQKDIIFGNQCENISVDIIKKHFSTSNLKKCEEYFVFDFEDDDNFYEIKGRRCNHNYYNSNFFDGVFGFLTRDPDSIADKLSKIGTPS